MEIKMGLPGIKNSLRELGNLYENVLQANDLQSMENEVNRLGAPNHVALGRSVLESLPEEKNHLIDRVNQTFKRFLIEKENFDELSDLLASLQSKHEDVLKKLQDMKNKASAKRWVPRVILKENAEESRLQSIIEKFHLRETSFVQGREDLFHSLSKSVQEESDVFLQEVANRKEGVRKEFSSLEKASKKRAPQEVAVLELSKRQLSNSAMNMQHLRKTERSILSSLRTEFHKIFDEAISNGSSSEEALIIVKNYAKSLDILAQGASFGIEEYEQGKWRLCIHSIGLKREQVSQMIARELKVDVQEISYEERRSFKFLKIFQIVKNFFFKKKIRRGLKQDVERSFQQFLMRNAKQSTFFPEKHFKSLIGRFYREEFMRLKGVIAEKEDISEDFSYELMMDMGDIIRDVILREGVRKIGVKQCLAEINLARCQMALETIKELKQKSDVVSNASRLQALEVLYRIPVEDFPVKVFLDGAKEIFSSDSLEKELVVDLLKDKMEALYDGIQKAKIVGNKKNLLALCEKFLHIRHLLSEELYRSLFSEREEIYVQLQREIEIEDLSWKLSGSCKGEISGEEGLAQKDRVTFELFLGDHRKRALEKGIQSLKKEEEPDVKLLLKNLIKEEKKYIALHMHRMKFYSYSFLVQDMMEYFSRELQGRYSLPSYLVEEALEESIKEEEGDDIEKLKRDLRFALQTQAPLKEVIFSEAVSKEELALFLRSTSQCMERRCFSQKYVGEAEKAWNVQRYMAYEESLKKFKEAIEGGEKKTVLEEEIQRIKAEKSQQQAVFEKEMEELKKARRKKKEELSELEIENLLLLQEILDRDPREREQKITEEENQRLVEFLSYIKENRGFNKRVSALLKGKVGLLDVRRLQRDGVDSVDVAGMLFQGEERELLKYGIRNKTLDLVRYLSFKMGDIETFERNIMRADAVLNALNSKVEISPDNKLSFKDFRALQSLSSLKSRFQQMTNRGFRSEECDRLFVLANRSREVIQKLELHLHEEMKKSFRSGDIFTDSYQKEAKFNSVKMKKLDKLWTLGFTEYHHAGLFIEGEDTFKTSEVYSEYVIDTPSIRSVLTSDAWHLNLSKLQFNQEFLTAFKKKYGEEAWKDRMQKDFEAISLQLNTSNRGKPFANVSNDWGRQLKAGKAKFKGQRMQKEELDFREVCEEMERLKVKAGEEEEDRKDHMFCSEFVVRMTLSAFYKLQEKYKKEFKLKDQEPFKMPFPKHRRLETVDPGSVVQIFQKEGILEKRDELPLMRKIFKEFS